MNDMYMPPHDLLTLLSIKNNADYKEMSGTNCCDTVKCPYRRGKKKAAQIV